MNFLKLKVLYFIISGTLILASCLALIIWGLKPAIDFTGGSLLEYQFANLPDFAQVEQIIEQQTQIDVVSIISTQQQAAIIKLPPLTQDQANQIKSTLSQQLNQEVTELRFESIGPTLGKELLVKTLWACLLATSFILAYIAWTFRDVKFGVTAILAMLHDTLILIGSFAILGHIWGVEADTLFVTAVLTTLSFSVHDTVVVFDRIREGQRQYPHQPFRLIANKALTETMVRSLNNSFTIIFMLTALMVLGGSTIRWFALSLLIGTIAGTYSSPFVAVPLLDSWYAFSQRRTTVHRNQK